ncbi:Uncharacterized protein TCM_041297 [Theobroma cacao]|uniref:Uncharacterized protein n=1 Tax=Theobroma cacao TaxID=3641 RepID=A0A061GU18_THECC|nr:Uncharacterized protein TCM_041297 [Theobroma cacao]
MKDIVCSHYGKKGHTKEKCYRLIGFLEDFKFTKTKTGYKKGKSVANNVTHTNKDQCAEIQPDQDDETTGNGFVFQLNVIKQQVSKLFELLNENGITCTNGKNPSQNSHQSKSSLVNLAFAGELTKSKKTCLFFTDEYCVIQDLPSWTVTGVARASLGWYMVQDSNIK